MSIKRFVPSFVVISTMLLAACTTATPESAPPAPTNTAPPPVDTSAPPQDTESPDATSGESAADSFPQTDEVISAGWQVDTIDMGIKPAIALDSQDQPHVTYMVEELHGYIKYASRINTDWTNTIVAEGYLYGPPAIAVDGDGAPHLIWHDHQDQRFMPDKGDAVVSVFQDDKWSLSTVTHPGHDGWDNSIVVDSQGVIHTAGIDPAQFGGTDGVEYAFFSDAWQVEAIGSGPIDYEFGTAIDVDDDNLPGITYFDTVTGGLKYAHRSADGTWSIATADDSSNAGKYSSLRYDADGQPHISYFLDEGGGSGTIRYAFWDGSGWRVEDVDTVGSVVQGPVGARHLTWLSLDSQGRPHIAYNDQVVLKYATKVDSAWEVEIVAEAGLQPFGQLVVMDLDAQDTPHLVYTVSTQPNLQEAIVKYAVKQD